MYKKKWMAYLFIAPTLLFLIVFLFYPFIVNIIISFQKYTSMLDENPKFVGIDNYVSMFKDTMFQKSLLNTLILILVVIVFQVGIALILALMVNAIKKFALFYKIVYFMPIVISATAIGLMINLFYDYNYGMFNQLLALFDVDKVIWMNFSNLTQVYILIVSPVVWQYVGFYFVIFLTGISGIDKEILEAAEIDGCTRLQQVRFVIVPMIKNVTRTVFILAITGTLKVFDLPHIINPGGYPNGKLFFMGTYMHDKAFFSVDIGVSAAFAVFMVFVGVVLSATSNKLMKHNSDL